MTSKSGSRKPAPKTERPETLPVKPARPVAHSTKAPSRAKPSAVARTRAPRPKNGERLSALEAQVGTLESELKKSERRLRREVRRREHAESGLRHSEARFRSLAAFGNHHVFVMNAQGSYLFSNREHGLTAGGERLPFVGRNQKEFHPREVAELYEAQIRAVLETGRAVEFEHFAPEPDGLHHHQDTLYPIEENGRIVALGGICRDVTAQKDVQHRLDLSEERYRRIVETANEGVWAMDGDYVTIYVNRRMADMLGYRPEEMIGRRVDFFMFPEDLPDHSTKMAARLQGENAIYERRFRCRDGRELWTTVSATALKDAGGQFAGSFAMFTDITKRKLAEDALLVYENMVSSSQDAMSLVDSDYVYRTANDTYLDRTGLARDRIVGRPVAEVMGQAVFDEIIKPRLDRSLAGEAVTYSEWFDFPTQGRKHVEVIYTPCRNREAEVIGAVVVARDITERKVAEEATARSQALLNRTQQLAGVGGWEWDVESHSMFWTEETYRIHDLEPQAVGSDPTELIERSLACYDAPDRPRIMEAFRRCAEEGKSYDMEFPFTSVKGRRMWVRTIAEAVLDGGRVTRVVGNIMDITERKRLEEILNARLRLSEAAGALSLSDLLQQALDEAERLTGSCIGFIHFVEEDQRTLSLQMWSTNTLRSMCTAEGKGRHYQVDEAGVWVDCVRERRPVIHNDYASLPGRKGLPAGHAPVVRELVVPILRNERVVAVLGVGNKPKDFDERDVETVESLANLAWDIVLRKKMETALRESEERLRRTFDESPVGIAIVSCDFHFRQVNAALCHITGYSSEELVGMEFGKITHPEDLAADVQQAQRLLSGEIDQYDMEKRYIHKDGGECWVHLWVKLLRDPEGRPLYFLPIVEDISIRKRMERELRQSHAELRGLYRLMQNAREEERRRISREIHDELGQNITAMQMDLLWLKKKVDSARPDFLDKLDAMSQIAKSTLDTIRRVSAELRPGILDELGLPAAVEWLVRDFENRTELQCSLLIEPEEMEIEKNLATDVFRVLQEALTNVARHARASSLQVSLRQTEGVLELDVVDDGIGISEEEIPRFGSLGLLGIRERLMVHGGDVSLRRLRSKGTCLSATIPIRGQEGLK